MILIVFVSINVVSANDNVTDVPLISDVVLNTSDADLLGENLVYNATLNSINNTPLSNQSVIFSVNGINYTRFTNLEGIAFLDINLNDGIYPISTIFKDGNGQQLINDNTIYVSSTDGTLIKDSLSGSEIQKIIDDANAGDALIFAGSKYNDVSIDINKPLNIISIAKSVFNGNSNSPVITVNSGNVSISNFVISSGSEGIVLNNVNDVSVSYNNIINNNNGLNVLNSKDVSIVFNNITNSKNIGINLKNSSNTNISANRLINNYNGIYFDEDVLETQIISNYISKSGNNAVNFAKSGSHTNMSLNIIERNENGIFFDMVGDEGINIEFNSIQRNNDNGIYFGENYVKTNETGVLGISNNSIIYNKEFNILARDSSYMNIKLKDNYVASDNPRFNGVCEKIKFNKYHMQVTQLDGNTLSVNVDGIKTDTILRVSYNGGKNWQTVSLVNGQATLPISNEDGNVMFDYYETNNKYEYQLKDYVAPTPKPADPVTPITPVTPDNPKPVDNNPSDSSGDSKGNGTNLTQGEQVEGNGTTSNPDSGSSQPQSNVDNSNNPIEEVSSQSVESSSSQAASQAVSSASPSQSVSKQISDPTDSVVKALSIDEEVVRIAGLSFIVLLILAVIGLYYRDDVKYMLNKRNGH